jgi:lipopolysaccharide transport system ATP-binding protein
LKSGYVLLPHFHVYTEEGVHAFATLDQDPAWRRRSRPEGRYVSTVWIPGNFLAEGMLFAGAGLVTLFPINVFQYYAPDAVAFQVVDSFDGDSARGDWSKKLGGVVRPLLNWSTQFSPNGYDPGAV